jgi:hypothetical protein
MRRNALTVMTLVVALALSTMAPALANAQGNGGAGGQGNAHGQQIINKPACEALGAEWSRDGGTASCVYTQEIDLGRVVDYEKELYDLDLTLYRHDLTLGELLDLVEIAEEFTDVDLGPLGPVLGLIPDSLRDLDIGYLRVSVEGRLILSLEVDLMLLVSKGASQQGVIGAPGTSDTYRPIFDLDLDADTDLFVGWEYCVAAAYAGYDAFAIPIPGIPNPFRPGQWIVPPGEVPVEGYEYQLIEVDVPGAVCTVAMIADILFVDA